MGNDVPRGIVAIGRRGGQTHEALAHAEKGHDVCLFDNVTLDNVGRAIRRRCGPDAPPRHRARLPAKKPDGGGQGIAPGCGWRLAASSLGG